MAAILGKVLANGTASAQAVLSIDMSAYYNLYDYFEIVYWNFRPATDTATLNARLSTDGSTFITTGYKWCILFGLPSGAGVNDDAAASDTTTIHLTGSSSSTTARGINGTIKMFNPSSATYFPQIEYTSSRYNNTPVPGIIAGVGLITTAQVNKGLQFIFSSGNISTGSYKVIGYK